MALADKLEKVREEEKRAWRDHPVTQELRRWLEGSAHDVMLAMGSGHTLDFASADRTALMTAEQVGRVRQTDEVMGWINTSEDKET